MSGCFDVLKSIFSFFLVLFLFILVLLGIPLAATSQVLVDREAVKSALTEEELISSLFDSALIFVTQNIPEGENGEEISSDLTDPDGEFRKELEEVISEERLSNELVVVIDAFYDWFEGKANEPEFSIQLAEDPDEFMDLFALGIKEKLASLPECTGTEAEIDQKNPMEFECVPKDFDIDSVDEMLKENQEEGDIDELLDTATISSDMLKITSETTENVQAFFSIVEMLHIILAAVYTAMVLLLIAVIPKVSRSFTIAGLTTIIPSGLLLFSSISSDEVIQGSQDFASQRLPYDMIEFSETIFIFIQSAASPLFSYVKTYSIVMTSVGAFLLLLGIIFTIMYKRKLASRSPTIRRPNEDY